MIPISVTKTPEVECLVAEATQLQMRISENQKAISTTTDSLCPICHKGHLGSMARGKALKLFKDMWLVCNECGAEFDKKLGKATLIKASNDPFGVFSKYANKTLKLDEWIQIAIRHIYDDTLACETKLSALKDKLAQYVLDQFLDGKLNLVIVDTGGFLLKKGEIQIFSTKAEVIEERKRKVIQRTSVGGGRRNYGGFSFRVAKGIYYHAGSSVSDSPRQTTIHSSEYTELISADDGDFLITNQRIMFKGNRSRGLAIPISKIAVIDVDPSENALLIVQENKKPYILKIQNAYCMNVAGLDISFSVDLDALVAVIKRNAV